MRTLEIGSIVTRNALAWRGKSLTVVAVQGAEVRVISDDFPPQIRKLGFPVPIEELELYPDSPFPIGSIVALKAAPDRQYIVEAMQQDVDAGAMTGHICTDAERQHYYTLRSPSGSSAYWWHSQLMLVKRS